MGGNEKNFRKGLSLGCGVGIGIIIAIVFVVVILPILGIATCYVPGEIFDRMRKARPEKAMIDVKQIGLALDMYAADQGQYPTTEQGLTALIKKPSIPPVPQNWIRPYVEPTEFKDPWGNNYEYRSPSIHGFDFDLFSKGEDGLEGTRDDIAHRTTR